MISYKKSVSLCFRGFEVTPEEVESKFGVQATHKGIKGETTKRGVKTKLRRSYVSYSKDLADECRLDEIIPLLFDLLGGLEQICEVRNVISPEYIEIDIVMKVKNSMEQEGGFLSPDTLKDLSQLKAQLSFQFL